MKPFSYIDVAEFEEKTKGDARATGKVIALMLSSSRRVIGIYVYLY